MGKIKVIRIIARLNIGGPAIHTVLLTEGLNKSRFDSLLLCGSISEGEGDMSYYAAEKNVQPVLVPELQRELCVVKDTAAFLKILGVLFREQPDILHTHTAKAGTLGRAAGVVYNFFAFFNGRRARLVHTFHGSVFEGYFSRWKVRAFIAVERMLAYFTSVVVTVSESNKKELVLLRVCPAEKIKVVRLGFELKRFLDIPFAGQGSGVFRIGIVGRLVPIKNHRLFLEAAALAIKERPGMNMRFKIIGEGELRGELEKEAKAHGIAGLVEFLGWRKDLAEVYSGLDIVALTSLNEGTPVSVIEAMASARVVVATGVGGVPDLLGEVKAAVPDRHLGFQVRERGILVPTGDRRSFADALLFMAEHGDLAKQIASAAREHAKQVFAKERLVRDMELLYETLLK